MMGVVLAVSLLELVADGWCLGDTDLVPLLISAG